MDEALRVRGLRKSFESQSTVRALRGVDLELTRGEFVAVMGPSGCGKSTLLNLVAGVDTPTGGEIVVAGVSLSGTSEDERARIRRAHIGFVFQFFNLLEGMSALDNVLLPAVIAGAPRRQAQERARDLLDMLGLADKAGDLPQVLSGGQRQTAGHRPCPGQPADAAARRRADRRAGLRRRGGGARASPPPASRRADHLARHPRSSGRRGRRSRRVDARRPHRHRRRAAPRLAGRDVKWPPSGSGCARSFAPAGGRG